MACTNAPPRDPSTFYKPQDTTISAFPATNDNIDSAGPNPNMSAQNFCKQQQAKSDSLANTLVGGLTSLSPMTGINKALGNLGATAQATTNINNNINNNISNTNRTLIGQTCNNAATIDQKNEADRTKCLLAAKCGDDGSILQYSTGKNDAVIQTSLNNKAAICKNITNSKITQSNNLNAQQNCTLNNMTKILSDVSLNTALAGILDQSLKSSGMLTKTTTDTNMCNSINNNVSAQTYAEAYQKCANNLNLTQCNAADCGAVDQSNIANIFQTCLQTNGVDMTSGSGAGNSVVDNIKQKLTADTSSMFIIIVIIILLVLGVGGYMYYKKKHPSG